MVNIPKFVRSSRPIIFQGGVEGGIPRLNVIKFGLKCQKCQTETKNVKNSDV